ncbi:MAG TPA: NAD(P)H-dependent oxidoreductase [Desulfobacterales bacterium]
MLILGLQGSPRKKGNSHFLLARFLEESERLGAETRMVYVAGKQIQPCKELVVCEKKGYCPIDDDMPAEIYPWLREAEVVVMAAPVFFYNVPAQLKALIDRCQTLWARKYRLKLRDPRHRQRRGFLLSVGATGGSNLFEGIKLTARYFFDAVDAAFHNSLTYRHIEGPRDMANHPTVAEDVRAAAADLLQPLKNRTRLLFAGRENAGYTQMAAALARMHGGDRLDVSSGGSQPAARIEASVVEVLQETGIDMAFEVPRPIDAVIESTVPDRIVTLGAAMPSPAVPGADHQHWEMPVTESPTTDFMRDVRDRIEARVRSFITELK